MAHPPEYTSGPIERFPDFKDTAYHDVPKPPHYQLLNSTWVRDPSPRRLVISNTTDMAESLSPIGIANVRKNPNM